MGRKKKEPTVLVNLRVPLTTHEVMIKMAVAGDRSYQDQYRRVIRLGVETEKKYYQRAENVVAIKGALENISG